VPADAITASPLIPAFVEALNPADLH
jgi:hypothetical protein